MRSMQGTAWFFSRRVCEGCRQIGCPTCGAPAGEWCSPAQPHAFYLCARRIEYWLRMPESAGARAREHAREVI